MEQFILSKIKVIHMKINPTTFNKQARIFLVFLDPAYVLMMCPSHT